MATETREISETATRRRFTVDEYHSMGEIGILHEDERVELINGEIVKMAAIGGQHIACVIRTDRWFTLHVGDGALVSAQNPVILSNDGEPEPDIALLRFREDYYANVPRSEHVLLLIEAADTSLLFDRRTKLPLYAGAGIPEVWIANLRDTVIEVYRAPHADHYQTSFTVGRDGTITPVLLPHLTVPVQALLG
jgi:Uma2 family endonuclease